MNTCVNISKLYRNGPLGNNACDPSGILSQNMYTWKLFKDNMGSSGRVMMDSVREAVGDLAKLRAGSFQGRSGSPSETSMAIYRSELDRLRRGSVPAIPIVESFRRRFGFTRAEQEKIIWEMDQWDVDEHGMNEQRAAEGGWDEEELKELAIEEQGE